ncbi:MAG: M28 family peptidase [Ignavibacteriales bacterium]|nr:M28 family peptidase [Ignavibacteriales bacterium]
MKPFWSLILVFFAFSIGHSQTSPFIDPKVEKFLVNELSGDLAMDNMRWLAHYHRTSGSREYHESALFIEKKAKEYGLEDVKIVQHKATNLGWSPVMGEMWVVEPTEIKMGSYAEYAVSLATNSRTTHVRAELVDVGAGVADTDYVNKDVKGKIVLTSSGPGSVMNQAVWKRGALGVVSYFYHTFPRISNMVERPDQVAWSGIPQKNSEGKEGTFGFMVSPRKGKLLQDLLKKGPVVVKVDIEANFSETAWEEYVEGWIKGSSIRDQQIFLTAHLQEEKPSYNDDGSGCISLLDIARTLVRGIKEGRLVKPKRDIRFFWADEISSEYQYFQDHPEDRKKVLVNINQDMVIAKQSMGSRIQHITRTPHSLPSFLSDVVENIANYVILGNTQFLAAAQAGSDQPYSKAILSHLGTRERFGAMVVPYFNSTDHLVFNEGTIGIPGVTLTNMPDDFIHSTDDDFQQADPTQLKRNSFIVAASAWYLANAEDRDIPVIAGEVYHTGFKRIHQDALSAHYHVLKHKEGDTDAAYKQARNLIEQAFDREKRGLESCRPFAQQRKAQLQLENLKKNLSSYLESTRERLDEFFAATTGKPLPNLAMTEKERELSKKIPVNNPNIVEYFAKRSRIQGMHGEMQYEVLNFVNGKNSYLDIFKAVQAEAMSAGEFYYGFVKIEDVEKLLDKNVETKAISLK